jgi:hypothetical protein
MRSSAAQLGPAELASATLEAQARRCRQILETSIIDFYLPASVDQTRGGYFESLENGHFAPTGERFVTLQARQLWFFSTLAAAGIEKDAAPPRQRALIFLKDTFTIAAVAAISPRCRTTADRSIAANTST